MKLDILPIPKQLSYITTSQFPSLVDNFDLVSQFLRSSQIDSFNMDLTIPLIKE